MEQIRRNSMATSILFKFQGGICSDKVVSVIFSDWLINQLAITFRRFWRFCWKLVCGCDFSAQASRVHSQLFIIIKLFSLIRSPGKRAAVSKSRQLDSRTFVNCTATSRLIIWCCRSLTRLTPSEKPCTNRYNVMLVYSKILKQFLNFYYVKVAQCIRYGEIHLIFVILGIEGIH